ncbi:MAG: hypothetical protein ACRC20_08875 [Segniliparus sp.]|uniref:hypothetical protein n=1 Tax=Segniliparus sp. TaxID=2804064 RepID=UPI003F394DF8
MSEASRRSGAELLEQELDRLRRAASGPGLLAGGLIASLAEPEDPRPVAPPPRPQARSWLTMTAALVFGLLLARLVGWLFDFPTDTLDASRDAPMTARGYQLLLISLAAGVMLVVFADVAAAMRGALGFGIASARQTLGCCSVLAAALVAHPWDSVVWLSEGVAVRHEARDVAAVLLAGVGVLWLYPRASRLAHALVAAVVVWELVAPYRLGWVEEPTTGWLGPDPASGIAALRFAALGPMYFTVLVACALVARGSGPRRGWHELLGAPAIVVGMLLLMPWQRFLWADPAPQQHQLVGWTLAGVLVMAQGLFLLAPDLPAPSAYDSHVTRGPAPDKHGEEGEPDDGAGDWGRRSWTPSLADPLGQAAGPP